MRILWLKTELLHPVDKGGKIRTYNMLKELKRDHHITYLALDEGADVASREKALEYCHELVSVPHANRKKFSWGFYSELALNLFSPLPYFMAKYRSPEMRAEISARVSHDCFDVLVCDFLMPSINIPHRIECATVIFQHNVEAMIWKRHYEVQSDPIKKAYLYRQWLKTQTYEKVACQRFDKVVAVSREDSETMKVEYGLSNVSEIPTGVDTKFFTPSDEPVEPKSLVFTGSMDWLPNQDAIHYFTDSILPKIRESIPDVTLTVVGRNPSASLLELSNRDPSLIVTGRVDDVRPYIGKAAVYIVPLRIGGGTRLKIFEALAMEKPLVSTTVGAEGLPVSHEKEVLLADTAEAFANAVVRVLQDTSFAETLARRGSDKVRTSFGWNGVAAQFAEICESAVRLNRERLVRHGSDQLARSAI